MANYTMEIRQLIDNPLIGLFTFDYDFYTDNPEDKEAFEKLFVQWYYFREIGFETPERFKLKLQAKLNMIMPYYRQLALTEWDKVRTVEEMMTSKNLKETTEHKQSIEGSNETESNATSSNNQSDSMNQSTTSSGTNKNTSSGTNNTTSTGTNTSTSTTNEKQSSLADGVAQASLTVGYLTAVGESSNNSSGESSNSSSGEATNNSSGEATNKSNNETNSTSSSTISSTDTSDSSSSTQGTAEQSGKTSGSNKQELMESITFSSVGDIGIQTPAYAITEWRKILININQMIIDDCNELFMKIY